MALSSRERTITIIVLSACAIFVLDRAAVGPYLDQRAAMKAELADTQKKLDVADNIFRREAHLRKTLAEMSGSIKPDAPAAEAQLLHVLHDWEEKCGLLNPSFQRVRTSEEHGYTNLSYHVSATGSMSSLAVLLYQIESAKIPLKVDDLQISPRHDNGEDLTVQFTISTLSRPEKEAGQTSGVADARGTP